MELITKMEDIFHDPDNTPKVKLPKQWKHWCKKAGFKIQGYRYGMESRWARRPWAWFYLEGKGYHWRVNCFAEFERGDTYEDFDRWARCIIDATRLPKTEAEFMEAVKLLKEAYTPLDD